MYQLTKDHLGRSLAAMTAVVITITMATPAATATSQHTQANSVQSKSKPPYPCWKDNGNDCGSYNGATAASYADKYALNPDVQRFIVFSNDCTNFVSQALFTGGESWQGPIPPGLPTGSTAINDIYQWWYNFVTSGTGRTFTWSVADDLFRYSEEEYPMKSFPNWWIEDYYSNFDQHVEADSMFNNKPAMGQFIPHANMDTAQPEDFIKKVISPLYRGDVVFYNWDHKGDSKGDGFFGNHDAMVAVTKGTDPKSKWVGTLIDEHTTNRKHAIWNLIPYNSQAQTTAAWYDLVCPGDPTKVLSCGTTSNRRRHLSEAGRHGSYSPPPPPAKAPAITTPASRASQLRYSGPRRVRGQITVSAANAAKQVFQSAMKTRQRILVPREPARTAIAQPPSRKSLDGIVTASKRELPALFTGAQLQEEIATVLAARKADMGSDVRVLAGGAGDFHYALVRRITPDKIRLRGTVRTWERYAQAQAGKRVVLATPHNTLDVVATLVHAKGGWRISSFNWAFAPGSQP